MPRTVAPRTTTRKTKGHNVWELKSRMVILFGYTTQDELEDLLTSPKIQAAWLKYKECFLDAYHQGLGKNEKTTFPEMGMMSGGGNGIMVQRYKEPTVRDGWTDLEHSRALWVVWYQRLFKDASCPVQLRTLFIERERDRMDWILYCLYRYIRHYERSKTAYTLSPEYEGDELILWNGDY